MKLKSSHAKSLFTDPKYRERKQPPKKGKGSYNRKNKHKGNSYD